MCVGGGGNEGSVVLDDYTERSFFVVTPTRNDVDVRKQIDYVHEKCFLFHGNFTNYKLRKIPRNNATTTEERRRKKT